MGFLTEALGIKAKEVISLVGAGGKTTLMFRLARELSLRGKKGGHNDNDEDIRTYSRGKRVFFLLIRMRRRSRILSGAISINMIMLPLPARDLNPGN